jgi:hypothetical protein
VSTRSKHSLHLDLYIFTSSVVPLSPEPTNSRDSSVGVATGYGLDDRVSILGGGHTASRPSLGFTQPPIHWITAAFPWG